VVEKGMQQKQQFEQVHKAHFTRIQQAIHAVALKFSLLLRPLSALLLAAPEEALLSLLCQERCPCRQHV
jgi:hypothetical protein